MSRIFKNLATMHVCFAKNYFAYLHLTHIIILNFSVFFYYYCNKNDNVDKHKSNGYCDYYVMVVTVLTTVTV